MDVGFDMTEPRDRHAQACLGMATGGLTPAIAIK
jgi:hypothetical protein